MTERVAGVRQTAIEAALAAGRILRHGVGQTRSIRHKGEIDLVTEIDVASEKAVVEIIRAAFPNHRILAEEGGVGGDDPRHRWIVDPLDGTTNYAHGLPFFCVSIGFEVDGEPWLGAIYDPGRDELFLAERGAGASVNGRPIAVSSADLLSQSLIATGMPYDRSLHPRALRQFGLFAGKTRAVRRIGSAALELAYVAAGRLDGYWESVIMPWDIAAGLVLVSEAGGLSSTLNGNLALPESGELLATNGRIHEEMLDNLAALDA